MTELVDLTDAFSDEGRKKIKVGNVLKFVNEGVTTTIKITKNSAKKGVWGKIIPDLITEDEAIDQFAERNKKIKKEKK